MNSRGALLALLLAGCATFVDEDGDGWPAVDDCDDLNPKVHPGAIEVCNGIDDDCDGLVDVGAYGETLWYPDRDGDGHGDRFGTPIAACVAPEGHVADNSDCDDDNPELRQFGTFFRDRDEDGWGDDGDAISGCERPSGYVDRDGDCDDGDPEVHPDAEEIWYDGIDQDCDGRSDFDADGDGVDSHLENDGFDCNDFDPSVATCGNSSALAARTCGTLHRANPSLGNGVYWLDPDGDGDTRNAFQAYCDMTRTGGGWTLVMQNNRDVANPTNPPWNELIDKVLVRNGTFGTDLARFDLWIGLSRWNDLGTEARVEVGTRPGEPTHQALYAIRLDPSDGFRLSLTNERILVGTLSSGLYTYHDRMRFSAVDRDQDEYTGNCASLSGHPWWYRSCASGSLWGNTGATPASAPYWVGSSQSFAWGAIWLR